MSVCGTTVAYVVPVDDNRERATCTACGEIHYENPINVVGTLPVWGDQVLLCRRNIEPRYGFWTLPAGFLELGESTAEGALRETDDAGLSPREVEVLRLVADGLSNRAIGERLVISDKTVGRHVSNLFCKLGVHNRAQATRIAMERGIAGEL